MNQTVLIVHGLGGSGAGHWQTWLAGRLRDRRMAVSYPDLPDPDQPSLEAWAATLEDELARLEPDGLTVACHSLGSVTWLHLAVRLRRRLADRVLLVAPPSAGAGVAEISEFVPAPIDADAVACAAGETRLVCAEAGDPYRPEPPSVYAGLKVPMDLIFGGGHLNTDAGYGPWPAVESWCLDPGATPVAGH